MAARQDQTLQITLIVFAILLVIFAGFTYWFYRLYSDEAQRAAQLQSDLTEQKNTVGNQQNELQELRKMMGYDEFANLDTVTEQFNTDMTRLASTLDEASRNYKRALEEVAANNQTLTLQEAQNKTTLEEQAAKIAEMEAGHQAQIAQFEEKLKTVEQQAASERSQFTEARARLDTKQQELASELAKQRETFDRERGEMQQQVADVQRQLQEQDTAVERLKERIVTESPSFEVPDGAVKWVNQANNTVWIDLGREDSLRRQVTFSVYDAGESDAAAAEKKGKIEVTRLLGENLAEAKVTEDDPRNPILPGDAIYSQVWQRGKQQHFALTGFIDLDNDGRSDLELAKDLIQLNGGVIDAFPNEEGEQEGKLTVDTRFLVLGEFPEKGSQAKLRDTWTEMSDKAKKLGIQEISLTDFMSQMGYKPQERTVGLGSSARPGDFRPRPDSPRDGELRPRSPYIAQ